MQTDPQCIPIPMDDGLSWGSLYPPNWHMGSACSCALNSSFLKKVQSSWTPFPLRTFSPGTPPGSLRGQCLPHGYQGRVLLIPFLLHEWIWFSDGCAQDCLWPSHHPPVPLCPQTAVPVGRFPLLAPSPAVSGSHPPDSPGTSQTVFLCCTLFPADIW